MLEMVVEFFAEVFVCFLENSVGFINNGFFSVGRDYWEIFFCRIC